MMMTITDKSLRQDGSLNTRTLRTLFHKCAERERIGYTVAGVTFTSEAARDAVAAYLSTLGVSHDIGDTFVSLNVGEYLDKVIDC